MIHSRFTRLRDGRSGWGPRRTTLTSSSTSEERWAAGRASTVAYWPSVPGPLRGRGRSAVSPQASPVGPAGAGCLHRPAQPRHDRAVGKRRGLHGRALHEGPACVVDLQTAPHAERVHPSVAGGQAHRRGHGGGADGDAQQRPRALRRPHAEGADRAVEGTGVHVVSEPAHVLCRVAGEEMTPFAITHDDTCRSDRPVHTQPQRRSGRTSRALEQGERVFSGDLGIRVPHQEQGAGWHGGIRGIHIGSTVDDDRVPLPERHLGAGEAQCCRGLLIDDEPERGVRDGRDCEGGAQRRSVVVTGGRSAR